MRDGGRITSTEESSFRKTMNILFPFAVYFVVHDLAQIVLAFLAGLGAGIFGDAYMEFVEINAATVNGVLNALSLVIGMAAVWPMAGKELKWAKVLSGGDAAVKMEGRAKAAEYVLLALFAAVFALAVNMLMVLAGLTRISESYQEVAVRQYGVAFGVGLLIYGLISPLAEDCIPRTDLQQDAEIFWKNVVRGRLRHHVRRIPWQSGAGHLWLYSRYCDYLFL